LPEVDDDELPEQQEHGHQVELGGIDVRRHYGDDRPGRQPGQCLEAQGDNEAPHGAHRRAA
jgi:hypothetical protein